MFRRHYSQSVVNTYKDARGVDYGYEADFPVLGDPARRSNRSVLTANGVVAQPIAADVVPPGLVKTVPGAVSPVLEVGYGQSTTSPANSNPHLGIAAATSVDSTADAAASLQNGMSVEEEEPDIVMIEQAPYGGYYPSLPAVPSPLTGSRLRTNSDDYIPNLVEDDDEEIHQSNSEITAPSAFVPSIAAPTVTVPEISTGDPTVDEAVGHMEEPPPVVFESPPFLDEPSGDAAHISPVAEPARAVADILLLVPELSDEEEEIVPSPEVDTPLPQFPSPASALSPPDGVDYLHPSEPELPDAPTNIPDILFPQVPTAAVTRRVEEQYMETREIAERPVAMRGRDDDRASPDDSGDSSGHPQTTAQSAVMEASRVVSREVEVHHPDARDVCSGTVSMSGRGQPKTTAPDRSPSTLPQQQSYYVDQPIESTPSTSLYGSISPPPTGEAYAIPVPATSVYPEESRRRQVASLHPFTATDDLIVNLHAHSCCLNA